MGLNQIENLFLHLAIGSLEEQLIDLGEWNPDAKGKLSLGSGYTFMLVNDKLTIGEGPRGTIQRKDITPVNCYNFYKPKCIAEAVQEFMDREKNPEKYINPFYI